MDKSELTWMFKEGRDSDGAKFVHFILVHGSGRICAIVQCPVTDDGYLYVVRFHCKVPDDTDDFLEFGFVALEAAQEFALATVVRATILRRKRVYGRPRRRSAIVDTSESGLVE